MFRFAASILTLLLAAQVASVSHAQQKPPRAAAPKQPSGVQIVVIDIPRVFQKHVGFNRRIEAVKADIEAFEKEMVARRKEIADQQRQLADLEAGSPEYKESDVSITKQMSDLQVQAQLKKKDLLVQEASIYFEAYSEVLAEVEQIAQRYGIGLVIRFDGEPIDAQDRASVLQGVNRAVVYQKNLDITDEVLERVNARHVQVSGTPQKNKRR